MCHCPIAGSPPSSLPTGEDWPCAPTARPPLMAGAGGRAHQAATSRTGLVRVARAATPSSKACSRCVCHGSPCATSQCPSSSPPASALLAGLEMYCTSLAQPQYLQSFRVPASVGVVGAPPRLPLRFVALAPLLGALRPGCYGPFRPELLSGVRSPCALPSGAACSAACRPAAPPGAVPRGRSPARQPRARQPRAASGLTCFYFVLLLRGGQFLRRAQLLFCTCAAAAAHARPVATDGPLGRRYPLI